MDGIEARRALLTWLKTPDSLVGYLEENALDDMLADDSEPLSDVIVDGQLDLEGLLKCLGWHVTVTAPAAPPAT